MREPEGPKAKKKKNDDANCPQSTTDQLHAKSGKVGGTAAAANDASHFTHKVAKEQWRRGATWGVKPPLCSADFLQGRKEGKKERETPSMTQSRKTITSPLDNNKRCCANEKKRGATVRPGPPRSMLEQM